MKERRGAKMNTAGSKENSGGHVQSVFVKNVRRNVERLDQEQERESS